MDRFWLSCLRHFENELPAQQFNTWIKPLRFGKEGERFLLAAPNRFVQQWIRDKFLPKIEELARQHFAMPVEFEVIVADAPALPPAETAPAVPAAPASGHEARKAAGSTPCSASKIS